MAVAAEIFNEEIFCGESIYQMWVCVFGSIEYLCSYCGQVPCNPAQCVNCIGRYFSSDEKYSEVNLPSEKWLSFCKKETVWTLQMLAGFTPFTCLFDSALFFVQSAGFLHLVHSSILSGKNICQHHTDCEC
jgi:hypothetical protein